MSGPALARWIKVLDQTRCIGCHACTTACKSENDVPLGVTRTYVKYVDEGIFPHARRSYQVTRCNQCEDAPCVAACPTAAMYQRADGIVDFDKRRCVGCKACIAACPYDAIFINPEDQSAEKCNFCAHRLDVGLEPACVVVCPTEAIIVGDLADPTSKAAALVARQPVAVRRPEKKTHPKVFYRGATQATLDPLAAIRPSGSIYMWSEQGSGPGHVASGYPADGPTGNGNAGHGPNSASPAVLAYDVPHRAPWDWRVSLYTWTKGIAAGVYLVALLLVAAGRLQWESDLVRFAVPAIGLGFLAVTGVLLIADLEHPERFYFIFTKPQWRSWLVRGGFIIGAYALALAVQAVAGIAEAEGVMQATAVAGVPLAVMAAVYTAYLFAQSRARDLWQSPLLPPHMAVQAALAGAAALSLVAPAVESDARAPLAFALALAAGAHLLMVWSEVSLRHPTAHAHLAGWEMTSGRFRRFFRGGLGLVAVGAALAASAAAWEPGLGAAAAVAGLAGLLAHEHAYVQAAQAVPLA